MNKYEIDTPSLLVDLDAMERNILKMAKYFDKVDANLRPHIKTHKTPMIAHKQLKAGAIGITCATINEAEVMANCGIKNIMISSEIVDKQKIERLVNLAKHTDIILSVDNHKNVDDLSRIALKRGVNLDLVIEVDVGLNRCGVKPGTPALRLAQRIINSKGLQFRGIMCYEGGLHAFPKFEERSKECKKRLELGVKTKELLEKNGIEVEIVSAGGTCTYNIAGEYPGITEVQAGTYVFMDAYTRFAMEGLEDFECAISVLTTVISKPEKDRAIVDAGTKAITPEFGAPRVKNFDDVEYARFFEEHGLLKIREHGRKIKIGDKLELIPSHACTTVNLYSKMYGVRHGRVETVWPIMAKGR